MIWVAVVATQQPYFCQSSQILIFEFGYSCQKAWCDKTQIVSSLHTKTYSESLL
ncbi:hypothetical protein T07_14262 [Trichinella nelsoni]|uniref:Uncharacterized protein n=1 Tax=Trichinella nelsoni TaxID=6336 RepID=A0A0V0RAR0_9BILA|nr:hypothetical protein T07_14262 [Trichinella nelsoni]